jgi:hypothetical protein
LVNVADDGLEAAWMGSGFAAGGAGAGAVCASATAGSNDSATTRTSRWAILFIGSRG